MCNGCGVDEDLNPLRQTMVQQANVVEFNKLNLDATDLLMSDKRNHVILKKESREESMKEDEVVGKLTSKRLSKALHIIDKALAIFDKEDPNTERGSKVTRDVIASVRGHSDILKKDK